MPASAAKYSAARWMPLPAPADAKVSLPGSFLASAISSGIVRAGTAGLTSTTSALVAIRPTGAKSLRGS